MPWLAVLTALVVITVAQEVFYETHRRRYGMWRSARARRLWMSREERSLAWTAFVHRDADRRVEASRLIAITLISLAFVALLAAVYS